MNNAIRKISGIVIGMTLALVSGALLLTSLALGKRLPSRGAGFLEGVVGNDLGALRNCLVNASLYVGEADSIELADLEA